MIGMMINAWTKIPFTEIIENFMKEGFSNVLLLYGREDRRIFSVVKKNNGMIINEKT